MVAGVGFKTATFPTQDTELTTGPPCLTCSLYKASKTKQNSVTLSIQCIVTFSTLPPGTSSCPCDPSNVLERNGAKSTNISRTSGDNDPRTRSSRSIRFLLSSWALALISVDLGKLSSVSG